MCFIEACSGMPSKILEIDASVYEKWLERFLWGVLNKDSPGYFFNDIFIKLSRGYSTTIYTDSFYTRFFPIILLVAPILPTSTTLYSSPPSG